MKILITGATGFIGYHTSQALSKQHTVIGIDNFSEYYDPQLKRDRLLQLVSNPNFFFVELDIINRKELPILFKREKFDIVIHLAAQPGVLYSIKDPEPYIDTNLVGTANLLEACRHNNVKHLIYASSSSVYGRNTKIPFSEDDSVDLPSSLYAATKRSTELMVESYSYLYDMTCTGLRFFTVYGPWGRPDMAYYKFTELLYNNKPIPLYNKGKHRRDMTYIDDVVDGIAAVVESEPKGHHIYNLGNTNPIELWTLVYELQDLTQKKTVILKLPLQGGDVLETYANIDRAFKDFGYHPKIQLHEGLENFIAWYKQYNKI